MENGKRTIWAGVLVLALGGIASAGLNDGLLAHYPFNGNANDETGNGHDGVVCGATLTTDRFGNPDSAYSLDGTDDYITVTNTDAFGFNNQSFSVSVWGQVRDNEPGYESFVHLSNQDDTSRFPIAKGRAWWTGSRVYTEFDSGWECQVISTQYGEALPLNSWMHLVSVANCETGKLQLYVDGEFQGEDDLVSFDVSSPGSPKLFFGMGPESDGNYLSGLLDDIRIYGRALTKAEVIELYTSSPTVPAGRILVDINPGGCPNPLNVKDKGVLPVAILGTADFEVTTVDVLSIRLEGVAPIRSGLEDVATPAGAGAGECACTSAGPDGQLDLTLKFRVQDIVAALGVVNDGDALRLTLTGVLAEALGGTAIEGTDCVLIKAKGQAIAGSPASL